MPIFDLKDIKDVANIKVGRKGASDATKVRLMMVLLSVQTAQHQQVMEVTDFTSSFGNTLIRLNVVNGSSASSGMKDLLRLYPGTSNLHTGKLNFLDSNYIVLLNIQANVYNGATTFSYFLTDFKIVNKDPKVVLRMDLKHQLKLKYLVEQLSKMGVVNNVSNRDEYEKILSIISRSNSENDDSAEEESNGTAFKKPKITTKEAEAEKLNADSSHILAPIDANIIFRPPTQISSQFPLHSQMEPSQSQEDLPYTMVNATQEQSTDSSDDEVEILEKSQVLADRLNSSTDNMDIDELDKAPQSTQTRRIEQSRSDESVIIESSQPRGALSEEQEEADAVEATKEDLKPIVGNSLKREIEPKHEDVLDLQDAGNTCQEEDYTGESDKGDDDIKVLARYATKSLADEGEQEQEQQDHEDNTRSGSPSTHEKIEESVLNAEPEAKQANKPEGIQEDVEQENTSNEEAILERLDNKVLEEESEEEDETSLGTPEHHDDENAIQGILEAKEFQIDEKLHFDGYVVGVEPLDFSIIGKSFQGIPTATNFRLIISNIPRDRIKIFKVNKNCLSLEFKSREKILEFLGYEGNVEGALNDFRIINKKLRKLLAHQEKFGFNIIRTKIHLSMGKALVWECLSSIDDILDS